jgi:flavin-dependent dehydrogenase
MHAICHEAIIVGGGPAGLAAAIALRQRGIDCAVLDGQVPPIDKACGEGLLPHTANELHQLGIRVDSGLGFPVRGIRFVNGETRASADFPNHSSGYGVKRTHLHTAMMQQAEQNGVACYWHHPVSLGHNGELHSCGSHISCKWLIGADGMNSIVRHWAGLHSVRSESIRYAFRRHYGISPWSEYIEVHWSDIGQIYITPVGPAEVCIALLTPLSGLRLDTALNHFPQINEYIQRAEGISRERGAVTANRLLHRVYRDRIALVGDASGSCDAIAGEGLSASFHQAVALADAVAKNSLALYQRTHHELQSSSLRKTHSLLLMGQNPYLRKHTIRLLAAKSLLFDWFLSKHTRPERILGSSRSERCCHSPAFSQLGIAQYRAGDPSGYEP